MKNKTWILAIGIIILFIVAGVLYNSYGKSIDKADNLANDKKQETTQEENENTNEPELFQAPNVTLFDANGKEVTLDSLKGKPIVINFWASKCPPCREEMPTFQNIYEDYKDKVHFVMLNSIGAFGETQSSGENFITENGYTFPVYFDLNGDAQNTYRISSFPTTFIINKEGYIVASGVGMINDEGLRKALDNELR